jgi:hypothetical protein
MKKKSYLLSQTKVYVFLILSFFYCGQLLAEESEVNRLKIEVAYVELHSGPGIGYPVLHVIEKNEFITVQVKRTSWLKVTDKRGNTGWLHQDELLGLTNQQGEKVTTAEITWNDFQARDYEAGVMYGNFEGAQFYNANIAYLFTSVFSGELSLGKALGSISDSDLVEVTLISQPFPELLVSPYIGIGGGIIKTKPHSVLVDSEIRQDTLMSATFGLKYHLARNFLLRAEYKHSLVLTDRDDNEEIQVWKVGFSVFF